MVSSPLPQLGSNQLCCSPRARCRRRGLGTALGEGGGSRAGGGSQDEASDSAPSRSALQCSSYKRRVGSVSCFLGEAEGAVSRYHPRPASCGPGYHHRSRAAPLSPFLPTAVPGIPEALGKRIVVDLQLCNLRDRGNGTKSRLGSSSLARGTPRSAASGSEYRARIGGGVRVVPPA